MTLDLDRLAPLPAAVAPPAREVNRKVVIDAKSFLTVEMTLDLVTILGLCPLTGNLYQRPTHMYEILILNVHLTSYSTIIMP